MTILAVILAIVSILLMVCLFDVRRKIYYIKDENAVAVLKADQDV